MENQPASSTARSPKIQQALLSVSDKSGLVDLAKVLVRHSVKLLSTGGTYKALVEAGLPVTEISAYTGFPEMLDGRVKTLHPKVHGGLLHRRDLAEHVATIQAHGIEPIDLVVVNLYPFEQTIAKGNVIRDEAIEQIDIGGPSMIRSAAKNHSHVAVLTDPAQYADFAKELDAGEGTVPQSLLRKLAVAAFERTGRYDQAIYNYLAKAEGNDEEDLPATVQLTYQRQSVLRYGENPHQKAAFYIDPTYPAASLGKAVIRHGKELSYNNLLDLDSALAIVREFSQPACVVIKHNNPCGAAVADQLADAFANAYASDPLSAFGSVLGLNRPIDKATAMAISEPGRFVEAIFAPSFDVDAFEILTTRPSWKASVRLLEVGDFSAGEVARKALMVNRPLEGGLLRQGPDLGPDGFADRKVVTKRAPTEAELRDLAFAWTMVKHVRSNAIVLARGGATLGVGAGQMSRVDSVNISIGKAGDRAKGAVLASDAFFPFRDNIDAAAKAGIAAIVQPGGSKRDQESIDACDEHGIAMIFTGMRHFKH
jgi:phosphoribosylaminoimidazolecarboxamide formyltransferase/IMP cyclohydrolase